MAVISAQASEPKSVQVLDRMQLILAYLATRTAPATLQEIAQATAIHSSSALRLLSCLGRQNFLQRESNGWSLGLGFLEYGNIVRDRMILREKALPLMQVLYEKTGETINLSLQHGDKIIYVEHVYAPLKGTTIARQIGALAPMHCTSGGKLFLSDKTPEEVSAYIARTQLKPRTQRSIHTSEHLIMELNRVKELGWSEDIEELEHGVQCMGAPIRDHSGKIVAAMTIASSSGLARSPEWIRHLQVAARAVSASLGWLES